MMESNLPEGQLLIEAMQSQGLLSNAEITEEEIGEIESSLLPYRSEEEAKLFEELATALGQVFQSSGRTIADEIRAKREA